MRARYGAEFHAFSEYDGFSLIENQKAQIVSDINSQQDNYILNVNQKNSSMLCIGVDVLCHSRKRSASGILLWKDSGQAGMTNV